MQWEENRTQGEETWAVVLGAPLTRGVALKEILPSQDLISSLK